MDPNDDPLQKNNERPSTIPLGFHPKVVQKLPPQPDPFLFQPPPPYLYNSKPHQHNLEREGSRRPPRGYNERHFQDNKPHSSYQPYGQRSAGPLPSSSPRRDSSSLQKPSQRNISSPKAGKRERDEPSSSTKRATTSAGSGFQTVAVTVPGSRKIQHFTICVGNRPEDVQAWIAERKKKFPRQQKRVLTTLLDGYGSSSESDDGEDKDPAGAGAAAAARKRPTPHETAVESSTHSRVLSPPVPPKNASPASKRTKVCHFFARDGSCRHGSSCTFLHEKPPSLLHRLLRNDQRRESLMALQILEYIMYESPTLSTADKKNAERP